MALGYQSAFSPAGTPVGNTQNLGQNLFGALFSGANNNARSGVATEVVNRTGGLGVPNHPVGPGFGMNNQPSGAINNPNAPANSSLPMMTPQQFQQAQVAGQLPSGYQIRNGDYMGQTMDNNQMGNFQYQPQRNQNMFGIRRIENGASMTPDQLNQYYKDNPSTPYNPRRGTPGSMAPSGNQGVPTGQGSGMGMDTTNQSLLTLLAGLMGGPRGSYSNGASGMDPSMMQALLSGNLFPNTGSDQSGINDRPLNQQPTMQSFQFA